jgi:hypothetical protein
LIPVRVEQAPNDLHSTFVICGSRRRLCSQEFHLDGSFYLKYLSIFVAPPNAKAPSRLSTAGDPAPQHSSMAPEDEPVSHGGILLATTSAAKK